MTSLTDKREAKFTKGPWSTIARGNGFTSIGANTLLARVYSENYQDFENEAANAALIAAAPDMYEAGAALIADVRRRYPGEELRCEYMRALDAALKKAVPQ